MFPYKKEEFYFQLDLVSFQAGLVFNPLITTLVCRDGKHGIKSKTGAIKCFKEKNISQSNECHNIPF